jgi:hypothetical protein
MLSAVCTWQWSKTFCVRSSSLRYTAEQENLWPVPFCLMSYPGKLVGEDEVGTFLLSELASVLLHPVEHLAIPPLIVRFQAAHLPQY